MAKDAYYFSHDSNAKDDPKCMLLIEELQLEWYGIYWLLVEVLREQENYKYPLRMVPVLARKFLTTKEKMLAVIYKYDLFVVENEEFFYSESLNRRMGLMNDKREQARLAGKKSGEARRNKALEYKKEINVTSTDVQQTFNDSSTDAEQLKESKVKESKVKEKKEIKIEETKEEFEFDIKKDLLLEEIKQLNISEFLKEKFIEWYEYKKSIKDKLKTTMSFTKMINQIGKDFIDEKHLSDSIDNSIMCNYKGVFPKEVKKQNTPQKTIPVWNVGG